MTEDIHRLKVIVTDPLDLDTPDLLRFRLNCDVECALAPPSKVATFIDKYLSALEGQIEETVHSMDTIDRKSPRNPAQDAKAGWRRRAERYAAAPRHSPPVRYVCCMPKRKLCHAAHERGGCYIEDM